MCYMARMRGGMRKGMTRMQQKAMFANRRNINSGFFSGGIVQKREVQNKVNVIQRKFNLKKVDTRMGKVAGEKRVAVFAKAKKDAPKFNLERVKISGSKSVRVGSIFLSNGGVRRVKTFSSEARFAEKK